MSNESFARRTHVEASADEVFRWHARTGAFERLAPPWTNLRALKILVSGSSGLIGSMLVPFLTTGGHVVVRLIRDPRVGFENTIPWEPDTGSIRPAALEGFDAVIHLAGESLDALRWSNEKKQKIRDSRSLGTRLLCETLAKLDRPPKVLLSASAIGFYGNRGDEILHEDSNSGGGFLPSVCRDWEFATKPAADKGIRVVNLRIGIVLSAAGGILAKVLTPFRLGFGGTFGTGRQYMSWIAIDDVISAIYHSLMNDKLSGPVNLVSPHAALNREFTKVLGYVLGRPTFCRVPSFVVRMVFGELADEMMLSSARVEPRRLLDTGYVFHYPEMEGALRHVLGRT